MRHLVGMLDSDWRTGRHATPVVLNTLDLINGHMLVAGMSGTGKSYQIQSLLRSCARERIKVDVFDVHEELLDEALAGQGLCCAAKYSAATRLGYNPLELHLDPHSGGVHAKIEEFVAIVDNAGGRPLGPRQESALRNLLLEVYALRGIYPDNARSWVKEAITEAMFLRLVGQRDYASLKRYYPTLADFVSFAQRKLKAIKIGTDNRAISALERVESSVAKLNGIATKTQRAVTDDEVRRLEAQLANERERAIEAYAEFVHNMQSGRETQDVHRYTNADTLIALIERIEMLMQTGIFNANPPEWGDAPIRVHQIGALLDGPRKALVYSRLNRILRECMDAGKADDLRRVALLDEGHLYYSDDSDNPINRIAKEGRKFGLGLVIASQSPTHFSEDFVTNCGTIMLTGLHETYWDPAARMLRIDRQALTSTAACEVVALKMQRKGEPSARFQNVNVSRQVVLAGIQRLSAATPA